MSECKHESLVEVPRSMRLGDESVWECAACRASRPGPTGAWTEEWGDRFYIDCRQRHGSGTLVGEMRDQAQRATSECGCGDRFCIDCRQRHGSKRGATDGAFAAAQLARGLLVRAYRHLCGLRPVLMSVVEQRAHVELVRSIGRERGDER